MNTMSGRPLFKKCKVFAHRGANREAMENTRDAFDRALRYAIDGIETDVQLSRDGVAVLWHDRFLDKIGMNDRRIDDFDYQQLKVLINSGAESESIMTLQEFLIAYRKRCHLLIEVKNRDWELLARHQEKIRQTLDLIGDSAEQNILVSSFNLASLEYARRYRPGVSLIYNFETDQTIADVRQLLITHDFLYGFCLPIASIDQAIVDLLHNQHKCIGVYTCNSEAEITQALQLGIDILISDLPGKALILRDQ